MGSPKATSPLSYRDAGVHISAGYARGRRSAPLARRTMREGVLGGIGGFGALFEVPKRYRSPVLVSGTDGVGTKLRLAFALDGHDTVGIDLVAMSVNDILVQGAEPLFFLDYFACGRLDVDVAARVVGGIAHGCEQAGCALIGGETAEMPDMYPEGEYDLAGFAVGVVEKDRLIDGSAIRPGDALLGLASSGAHSNGYSLIRRVIERTWGAIDAPELQDDFHGVRFADAVLAPTRLYVRSVRGLIAQLPVKGIAHITGGGLIENVPRVLPAGVRAVLHRDAWTRPPLFDWLERNGAIDPHEMHRVFNCGIGMVVVVEASDAERASRLLREAGETVFRIGEIVEREDGAAPAAVV